MIRINNLNKYFNKGRSNEVHVIHNTTLEFDRAGLVCILGESGSGKTTLLNTLGGLDTFHSGSIQIEETILDRNAQKTMERIRNDKYGYIFQDQYLLQDHSVAYNIRLALSGYELGEEEKEARVDYVLQAVDMKKYKKRLVSQLSGGQQQRIAIARALVKSPEVIFADEPTGNLDEVNTMRVMSIIKKISKECLVILVTHEKRIAEFFADRIIHIRDGCVVKDLRQEERHTLMSSDDIHLYLKEYEKEAIINKNLSVNLYNNNENNKLTLDVVCINDKFYVQTPDETKVVFLTSKDEMKLIDDYKPEISLEQIEDFDYSLPRLKVDKKSRLPWKEVYSMAKANIKMLGMRQIFIMVSFIITAILLVVGTADYLTAAAIDKKDIITEDSHYINVASVRNSSVSEYDYLENFSIMFSTFQRSNIAEDIYIDLNAKLSFAGRGFDQLSNIQYTLTNFSYVTLEHLQEKDLILGRMPENKDEVILDRWLIDVFLESDSILKISMTDPEDFLGLELFPSIPNQKLLVVGICDMGEPTIFIDKYKGMSISSMTEPVASLSQLQAAFPGSYEDISLAVDEILVSEAILKSKGLGVDGIIPMNGSLYKVRGTFPEGYLVQYVVEDTYYPELLNWVISRNKKFMIYSKDKTPILNYFAEKIGSFETEKIKLVVKDTYGEQLAEYEEEREGRMNARMIITATIFTASLFMLYFTMKSNAVKRVQEISVYRLMGITKGSILFTFMLEIIMVTNATVLPVVLILSGMIRFISARPSLQINIVYPWWIMALLLLFIYAVHIMIGIFPVRSIVKLPPAHINEKA